MIKSYRKKPVVIEALCLTPETTGEAVSWLYDSENEEFMELFINTAQTFDEGIIIPTLEGNHLASYGDMIIKGVNGEFYPCKPDIFEKTYEEA